MVGDVLPPNALPFAEDWAGNLYCLKLAGPRAGEVVFWDHERELGDHRVEPVASSIDEFYARLVPNPELDAPDIAPLHRALVKAVPDESERIRALLAWYGSGKGPWSGFPSYEFAAEHLLLRYPTPAIVAAIEGRELTAAQTEGAARLFGAGPYFSRARPDALRLLPQELKQRLLAHSLQSSDEDKRRRAQRAFGEG